jgi:hypothetical protein
MAVPSAAPVVTIIVKYQQKNHARISVNCQTIAIIIIIIIFESISNWEHEHMAKTN